MTQLSDLLKAAVEQADKAYEEAIKLREPLDELRAAIPDNDYLFSYMTEIRETQEQAVQLVSSAYDIKHDLEEMEEGLQTMESVKGE